MKKISLITKLFWKTIKPSFFDKIMTRDRINLSEKGELVKTELETAEVLNKFFSNIVNNLEISKYSKYESFKITRALLLFKINSKVEMFFISENWKKRKFRKKSIT